MTKKINAKGGLRPKKFHCDNELSLILEWARQRKPSQNNGNEVIILFADIEGSTQKAELAADQRGIAYFEFISYIRFFLAKTILQKGRLLTAWGDGFLVEFNSLQMALDSIFHFNKNIKLEQHRRLLPDCYEDEPVVRFGLHKGVYRTYPANFPFSIINNVNDNGSELNASEHYLIDIVDYNVSLAQRIQSLKPSDENKTEKFDIYNQFITENALNALDPNIIWKEYNTILHDETERLKYSNAYKEIYKKEKFEKIVCEFSGKQHRQLIAVEYFHLTGDKPNLNYVSKPPPIYVLSEKIPFILYIAFRYAKRQKNFEEATFNGILKKKFDLNISQIERSKIRQIIKDLGYGYTVEA